MKHYKTFGQTGNDFPSPHQGHTPIDQVDVHDAPPTFVNNAVRNFEPRQPYPPPPQQMYQPPPQQMYQPPPQQMYQPPQHMYQHQSGLPSYSESKSPIDKCLIVSKHIHNCPKCAKLYASPGNNLYICIIVFLLMIILLLLTKLIDKN